MLVDGYNPSLKRPAICQNCSTALVNKIESHLRFLKGSLVVCRMITELQYTAQIL